MATKYKVSLKIIGFLLLCCLFLLISYSKYKIEEKENNPIVIVNNGLSINYMHGNNLKIEEKDKLYKFSVTNNSENSLFYYIYLDNINSNKTEMTYALKEKLYKINIIKNEINIYEDTLASLIEIGANETQSFELIVYGADKLNLSADLVVQTEGGAEEYFAATILGSNEIKKETKTKIGEAAALENEGLIEASDSQGSAYYFRGNVPNNYVQFANRLWRIVKINGDGSVKLILNDYIDNTANYYNTGSEATLEDKLDFSKSNIRNMLKTWYDENLAAYDKFLATSKYCVDDAILRTDETSTYYLASSRLTIDYSQDFNCVGSTYAEKIGLLTADEASFAGASPNADNTQFFLYNAGKLVSWWTATPSKSEAGNVSYFEVSNTGKLQIDIPGNYFRGLKPVINLLKKTTVTGEGTVNEPYVVE